MSLDQEFPDGRRTWIDALARGLDRIGVVNGSIRTLSRICTPR